MKKISKIMLLLACGILCCTCFACKAAELYVPAKEITVALFNGSHYSVVGENSRTVEKGGTVIFEVALDRGYQVVDSIGDACEISQDVSFTKTVTFSNVTYKMSASLKTEALDTSEFSVCCNEQMGEIGLSTALGAARQGAYYVNDIININATPKPGHQFVCWSSGGYIQDGGGTLYSNERTVLNVDFTTVRVLYANFAAISYTPKKLVYKMESGREIEQDCTMQLAYHYRANTLSAVDMRKYGVDCDSKYLVGWQTETDEYVALGSRVAIEGEERVLTPIWKEYTPSDKFTIANGVITGYFETEGDTEVVIPNKINGETVAAIGANAFADCSAKTFYLPDTVDTVEDNAFSRCENLTEFYMSDNVLNISDKAFIGCANFQTVYLNAYSKPKFRTERVAALGDVYDRLALNADNGIRKVVVLGGSGTQAGYSCSVIEEMFESNGEIVEVYNFGWSAAYCGLAQFEIINHYLREGDIFLHAPEHYNGVMSANTGISPMTGDTAIALTEGAPHLYNFTESNLQFISLLTVYEYSNLFRMFSVFNGNRRGYSDCTYEDYCSATVQSGYGYRSTNEQIFQENGVDKSFGGALDILPFARNFERLQKSMYAQLPDGVLGYVVFPAINRANMILTYGDEEKAKIAADSYTAQVKEILCDSNVQVLLTQYDTFYDGRHFYNHDYHLGHPTRNSYTEKVFSALMKTLAPTK